MIPTEYTYYVRQLQGRGNYAVSKFGDDPEPDEVYDVTLSDNGKVWCSCLGFRRQNYPKPEHKHILLVKLFKKLGEPPGQGFAMEGRIPKVEGESFIVDLREVDDT